MPGSRSRLFFLFFFWCQTKNILFFNWNLVSTAFLVGESVRSCGFYQVVTRNASGGGGGGPIHCSLPEIPCPSLKWEYGTEGEFCPELGICATFHSDFWSFLLNCEAKQSQSLAVSDLCLLGCPLLKVKGAIPSFHSTQKKFFFSFFASIYEIWRQMFS